MNVFASFISEAGQIGFVIALASHLSVRLIGGRMARNQAALLGVSVGAVGVVLPDAWNLTFFSRALIGEPGALGWIFLLHLLLHSLYGKALLSLTEARALALPAVAGAALIYPASLGVPGAPDFYNADFGGFALPTVAVILAGFYLWRGFGVAAAGVAFGLFLYGLDLHESANLWDCLFDFPSVVVSAVIIVKWVIALRRLRSVPVGASLSET